MLLAPLIIACLGFCVSPVNAAAVAPQRHELAYDDGSAESSTALPYAESRWGRGNDFFAEWIGHNMLAVQFTSTTPQELLGARFYITGELGNFTVRAFNSERRYYYYQIYMTGGSYLYEPDGWDVAPNSTGWVDVDLSDQTIFVTGDFYVALEFTTGMKPSVGVDTTTPAHRSWYVKNNTYWEEYSDFGKEHNLPDGNIMIRVVLGLFPSTTETSTSSMTTSATKATSTLQQPSIPAFPPESIFAGILAGLAVLGIRRHHRRRR